MGKKSKKQAANASDDAATAKREQPLQAVLLADSFTEKFRPLSLDRPKVLCPLNNVTMIDYSMDFLAGAGVEELFVACVSDQVEDYVTKANAPMEVTVVKDNFFANAGDALREIDKRNLVQSDPFILMFGDTVTNVDLTSAIAAHKERHKKDSRAIMTMLMKPIGSTTATMSGAHESIRPTADDLVVGMDPTHENRILVYDNTGSHKTAALPCSFFATNPEIELHTDLYDCGIDICSPDVLARISDNFDYGDIRQEFVTNSVAEEEEGLQNRIFGHLLRPAEYAARVHDFYTYAAISRDLLRRWCYPVVPDHNGSSSSSARQEKQYYRYARQRHYMYRETLSKIRVGRSSVVRGPGMIGTSCFVGENCTIQQTVVGNFCHIAAGAVLSGCHLWDGVDVGEGATVIQSILADGAVVRAGAVVSRGCCIGAGCIVGKNVVLPPFTRLTLKEEEEDDFGDDWDEDNAEESSDKGESADDQCEPFVSDVGLVGPDGKGRAWMPQPEEENDGDEDDRGLLSLQQRLDSQSIGFDRTTLAKIRSDFQQEPMDAFSLADVDDMPTDDKYADVVTFSPSPSSTPSIVGRQKGVDVIKELMSFCLEYELTSPIENLAIELNSFKFSQNATYSDCTIAATMAILERMNITKDITDGKLVADFKSSLEHWAPLLQKMSIGLEEEKAIVLAVERCAIAEGTEMGEVLSSGMSFRFLLQTLHDEEIVSEEAILDWAKERNAEGDTARGRLFRLKPVQDFLEWLQEESEEDGSEDDNDGNEEDSE